MTLSIPPRFVRRIIGRSVRRRPIVAHVERKPTGPTILILGGFHGDEPKSVHVAEKLIEHLSRLSGASGRSARRRWVIVPLLNPDGHAVRKRRNARNVDINRNFPTADHRPGSPRSRMYGGPSPASEPETRAVMRIIERFRPDRIVTIHSIGRHRFCNNYDGPARAMANAMSRTNGYPVTATIGYPTPGSFGTWAGVERGIAVVTLELPSHHSPRRCWEDNRDALVELA